MPGGPRISIPYSAASAVMVDVQRRHVAGRRLEGVDEAEPLPGGVPVGEDAHPAAQEVQLRGCGD
ncbi:MAG TPA: hypothetical protein VG455_07295, partial [Acidimicrobiales bacterium]|nr:hypothetical protein [Acidimicrobiales bacterium]